VETKSLQFSLNLAHLLAVSGDLDYGHGVAFADTAKSPRPRFLSSVAATPRLFVSVEHQRRKIAL
jgi:hypothetical protein